MKALTIWFAILFIAVGFVVSNAFADDEVEASNKLHPDCVIAVSDVQLQELSGTEQEDSSTLELLRSELQKNGWELQNYAALDADARAEYTGRALFLQFRGAIFQEDSCKRGHKWAEQAGRMDLALVNSMQGQTFARADGSIAKVKAPCRQVAAESNPALRVEALKAVIGKIPSCQALAADHKNGWLF